MHNVTLRSRSVIPAVVLVVLALAVVAGVVTAPTAHAQQPPALPDRAAPAPAPTPPAEDGRTVRLVQRPDGSLEVQRGPHFAATSGTLLAKETDVLLATADLQSGVYDSSTGMVTDALRRDQWNLDAVRAESAWRRATGTGQVIAVIDSGVDGSHPDLRDRLVPGFSAVGGDPATDGHGHGTHVAGTAAASVDGEYGVAGLAPQAGIMPVKVTNDEGLAYSSDVAEGLIWAVGNGATVANMSLAGTQESSVLNAAIDYAVANGVVVVVAGGNEYQRGNPPMYPASHPSVVAVAAMSDPTTRSTYSSTGDWIDLAAPGSAILSTRPDASFGRASGTSMAAPLVAGAVAVLRSAQPDLDHDAVVELLLAHADDLGAIGWDVEYGHGALDLVSALEELTGEPITEPQPEPEPEPEPEGPPAPSAVPDDVDHFQRG